MDVSLDDLIQKDRQKGKDNFKGKKQNVLFSLIVAWLQDQKNCSSITQ